MTPKESSSGEDWVQVADDDQHNESSSHEEDQEEEEHEESDVDEDDDDEEESWFQEVVMGAWKQHVVAVLVAIVAATYSHGRLGTSFSSTSSSSFFGMGGHHDHVHTYKRTAGLEFCPNMTREQDTSSLLQTMDFRVPLDLVHAMEQHYHADHVEDDDYSQVVNVDILKDNKEYTCLKELESITTQSNVQGYAKAWVSPKVSDIYTTEKNKQPVSLSFTGFAAKFVNLSPKPVLLHWDGTGGTPNSARLVAEIAPFQAVGTATTPGQSFFVSPVFDGTHALERWIVTADSALIVYHPMQKDSVSHLSEEHLLKYRMQMLNLAYAKDYLIKTGRTWLAAFPRPRPLHYMHPAQYLGQRFAVDTQHGREEQPTKLEVQVVSVQPRAFQIENFLSVEETQHLIQLGQQQGLKASTVHPGDAREAMRSTQTRSSTNAWIERQASTTVDLIYKRAADLLNIDESLFRHRSPEHVDVATHNSIAESLQLVHYGVGEEYTPHHDFVYPSISNRYQPTRFATLLLYLSDDVEGGETVFPRALNAEFHDGIAIEPKIGRAVLFYNILEDGNVDDTSQHGSKPVIKGDKWLANLWVWDPIID